MSMTILYPLGENLYVNMTNRCNCSCTFCLRSMRNHVRESDNLWLEHEPSVEEVLEDGKKFNFSDYKEIVFCGFGEPTERLTDLLTVASKWKEENPGLIIRLNTNGLSDLRFKEDTAKRMAGIIDKVSVSMNSSNPEHYLALTRSIFGIQSYDAMLQFGANCKKHGIDVRFSIVDVLSPEEIEECKRRSGALGVPLKIRKYNDEKDNK